MQLDLFTYVAQLINFALLIFLLRRFLYRPITTAMATREQAIAARFEEAEAQRERAHQEAKLFHERRTELETERAGLLAQTQREAAEQREAMILAARAEVDELQEGWRATVEQEQQALQQQQREQTAQQIFELSGRLLAELADAELEAQIARRFVDKLRALEGEERHKLHSSLQAAHQNAVLCSAFPLAAEQRRQIDDALTELLNDGPDASNKIYTRHVRCPDLIAGIELRLRDQQLAWNVADELHILAAELGNTLNSSEDRIDSPVAGLMEIAPA